MNKQSLEVVGVVSVGGLAAIGHFCAEIQPILADFAYLAAIVTAAVTAYRTWRKPK
jgi:hypothetical protein